MSEDKFVFLITIDDLRKDKLGLYGESPSPSTFLDGFAEKNMYKDNHFSVAPSSPTSFRSIFTSTYPMQFRDYDFLSEDRPYLPEILSRREVKTVGFNSNPYISEHFGFDRGFDHFFDYMSRGEENENRKAEIKNRLAKILEGHPYLLSIATSLKRIISGPNLPYPEAEQIVADFKAFSRKERIGAPAFFWIHFMEPHSPLIPPKETYGEYNNLDLERRNVHDVVREGSVENMELSEEDILALYKECIKYLDMNLEELFKFIEDFYGEDNTEIIITSDHGELLGEYGEVGHPEELKEVLFKVPLTAKLSKPISAKGATSHLDILPTVLQLFDLSSEKLRIQGESLLDRSRRESLIVEAIQANESGVNRIYMTNEVGIISESGFERSESYFDVKELPEEDKIKKHVQRFHSEEWTDN